MTDAVVSHVDAAAPARRDPGDDTAHMTAVDILVRQLSKTFDGRRVIKNLGLRVPAGQFLAVVGRSGCGKSTLLRLLSGLETADSGDVQLGATTVSRPQPSFMRLMFQEPRLLPWSRVADNVALGLGPDLDRAAARSASVAALRQVGLEDRADDWPATLSGGQKQRVALARALVSSPRVLALDEPLGSLDALTRIEMQRLIERVYLERRFTAVLVTHDVSEALALADRVIMLDGGAIVLDVDVALPRPRQRGTRQAAELEAFILERLLEPRKLAS